VYAELREMRSSATTTASVAVIVAAVVIMLAGLAWGLIVDWFTILMGH